MFSRIWLYKREEARNNKKKKKKRRWTRNLQIPLSPQNAAVNTSLNPPLKNGLQTQPNSIYDLPRLLPTLTSRIYTSVVCRSTISFIYYFPSAAAATYVPYETKQKKKNTTDAFTCSTRRNNRKDKRSKNISWCAGEKKEHTQVIQRKTFLTRRRRYLFFCFLSSSLTPAGFEGGLRAPTTKQKK